MADAKRDGNYITTLLAVSNADGITPVVLYADPTTHRLLVSLSGSGSVSGPVSSTDNAIVRWDGTGGSTLQDSGILVDDSNNMVLVSSDGGALGSATKMWSDLFLASGALINFNNGNVVVTHSAGILTVSTGDLRVTTAGSNSASVVTVGGNQTLTSKTLTSPVLNTATVGTSLLPTSDDGAPLGDTTHNFSDLFLATGAVINYANSNVVITHSSGILTMGTGDLRITTAGTNAASVVTVGGAQTLTSKVLTAATITTGLTPTSSDGAALGTTALMFSDLFLASGGVINFNNGNVTITHSAGVLTLGGSGAATLALGTNSITMTGSIGATGARVTKVWTADLEVTNDITINGTAIATTYLAKAGGTLTGNITLGENTSIDLDPAGSADGKYSGICITGTAGTTLAFGDLIYLAVADSRWELTDADAVATSGTVLIGMCVLAAAGDGSATKILLQGQIRADAKFPALTVGAAVYAGETAGAIQVAIPTGADNVIRVMGFALTADEIYFNPSQDHQTTVA